MFAGKREEEGVKIWEVTEEYNKFWDEIDSSSYTPNEAWKYMLFVLGADEVFPADNLEHAKDQARRCYFLGEIVL